jgi:cytochrome P450
MSSHSFTDVLVKVQSSASTLTSYTSMTQNITMNYMQVEQRSAISWISLHLKGTKRECKLTFDASRYPWFTAGGGSPHSIFETNTHDLHRLRRGALNPFFSKRSIVSIEPIINDKIARLCALFRQQLSSQRPVELRLAFSSLTIDIISNYCFGESWNCLENDKLAKEWKTRLDDAFEKASLIMHFPWILAAMNALPDSITAPIIRHYRVSL